MGVNKKRPKAIEKIVESLRPHAINLLRYDANVRREVLKILKLLEADLIEQLFKSEMGSDGSVAQSRARSLLSQAESTISAHYGEVSRAHLEMLEPLAAVENEFLAKAFEGAFRTNMLTDKLTAGQLKTIASDTLIRGAPSSEWWSRQSDSLTQRFSDEIRAGLALGETNQDLVRRVRGRQENGFTDGVMAVPTRDAQALVRSSVQAVANQTRVEFYQENDDVVKGYIYHATLDNRTTQQCFTGENLVFALGAVRKVFRRFYEGEFIIIGTTAGKQIRCTPKHPILTARGWLSADEVDPTDQIFYAEGLNGLCALCAKNIGVPPSFAQLSDAAFKPSIGEIICNNAATTDFHGDGCGGDNQVHVAAIKSHLMLTENSSVAELGGDESFGRHCFPGKFDRNRSLDFMFGIWRPFKMPPESASAISEGGIEPALTAIKRPDYFGWVNPGIEKLNCTDGVSSRCGASIPALSMFHYAKALEESCGGSSRSAIFPCQCCGANAVTILGQNVSGVRAEFGAEHVYNLETESGIYFVSGIVSHNCASLDGYRWNLDYTPAAGQSKEITFVQPPSAHWGCRSTLLPWLKTFDEIVPGLKVEMPQGTRASMDGPQVPASDTYEDWLRGKDADFQNDLLGVGKARLFREGKASLLDMVDQSGRPLTLAELKAKVDGEPSYLSMTPQIDANEFSGSSYFIDRDEPVTASQVLDEFPPDTRDIINGYEAQMAASKTTEQLYSKDGVYTPEREAMHNRIIDKILNEEAIENATPADGEKPTFTMLGGRGGSGKSKFRGLVYDRDKTLLIDPDFIKESLDGYRGWNAGLLHAESSYLTDKVIELASRRGLNITMDVTMRSADSALQRFAIFEALGYNTEAHYMYLPRATAARRAVGRALGPTRRYVSPEVVLSNTGNEAAFDRVRSRVRRWSFWDNSRVGQNETPELISRGGK